MDKPKNTPESMTGGDKVYVQKKSGFCATPRSRALEEPFKRNDIDPWLPAYSKWVLRILCPFCLYVSDPEGELNHNYNWKRNREYWSIVFQLRILTDLIISLHTSTVYK